MAEREKSYILHTTIWSDSEDIRFCQLWSGRGKGKWYQCWILFLYRLDLLLCLGRISFLVLVRYGVRSFWRFDMVRAFNSFDINTLILWVSMTRCRVLKYLIRMLLTFWIGLIITIVMMSRWYLNWTRTTPHRWSVVERKRIQYQGGLN